jgi:hypothetical protein
VELTWEATVQVREVKTFETRSGNTRFVLFDEKGKEYTTFRPEIGDRAQEAVGKRAGIEYHEQKRDDFFNVYLDAVEIVDAEEEGELPADELFQKLKKFKELVEDDIEGDR